MGILVQDYSQLLSNNIDSNVLALDLGGSPLTQKRTEFFQKLCLAISTGIANGAPIINFNSINSGVTSSPPIPGVGIATKITVNTDHFAERLYKRLAEIAPELGYKTVNEVYPPSNIVSKCNYAMCLGIAQATATHFETCWVLTGTSLITNGIMVIPKGGFFGIDEDAIAFAIQQAAGSDFNGIGWPHICKKIALAYKETIEQEATATGVITGVCIPMSPPAGPLQICGIPASGIPGTGAAS